MFLLVQMRNKNVFYDWKILDTDKQAYVPKDESTIVVTVNSAFGCGPVLKWSVLLA